MAKDSDDALTALMLVLGGGAASYAAGHWLVGPWLDKRRAREPSSSRPSPTGTASSTPPALAAARPPRALVSGPPLGAMPIDPYAQASTTSAQTAITGPITHPSQLATQVSPAAPAAGPITHPSQIMTASGPTPTAPFGPSGAALPIDPYAPRPAPMPSQLVGPPAPSARSAVSPSVRRFDPTFERYRGALPIEYVRALVERESGGNPNARAGSGAIGLMQIVPVVIGDYNRRHGSTYTGEQLVDPAVNVAIGCELLRLISDSYRKNHPRVANLQANWNNPRFVELLTFGWNAGFSEAGGVGRVASYLEQRGALDITIDLVTEHARIAGASKHLSNPAKVQWCKSVAALYLRERAATSGTSARLPTS